ncbi:hypothetical protein J6590_031315 [Homalodisca vitripennis]|nr:hypothetical protein J6590_031315 [Homalodisca vitripennis]
MYSDTFISENKVRKWVQQFKDGHDNVHDEDNSSRPYLVTDDLVASVEAKIQGQEDVNDEKRAGRLSTSTTDKKVENGIGQSSNHR